MGNGESLSNIWEAAHLGHLSIVKKLLDEGVDINSQSPNGGYTALICAAAAGHVELVKFLLQQGADLSLKDKFGYTAITAAESEMRTEVVEILEMALSVRRDSIGYLFFLNYYIFYILMHLSLTHSHTHTHYLSSVSSLFRIRTYGRQLLVDLSERSDKS